MSVISATGPIDWELVSVLLSIAAHWIRMERRLTRIERRVKRLTELSVAPRHR